jgi:Protein of unknown function (DUF2510)
MSQVSPGWYPDPSGRFAQRYHDGTRWTEHVADAQGNRATDVPAGQAGPASYPGSAQPSGQGGQRSSDPYGQQAARDQGRGQESPGTGRGHGQRPGERSWDQGAGAGSQAQAGGQASRHEWAHAEGAGQQGDDSWADARSRGRASGGDWRAAGQGPGAARYDAGPGPGAARHDAGRPYEQPTGYGRPDYAYAPPASSRGFTPTIGLIMAAVGAVLVLLSLFGLDFLELSFPGLSRSISLGDIAGDFGEGAPAALGTYADFGRFLAVLVIAFAILAVARVVPQLRDISALPAIVAVACGGFALWHVLAMLASGEEGVDVSPTFGAILGLLGYVGLAAGPFLRQPIQAQR